MFGHFVTYSHYRDDELDNAWESQNDENDTEDSVLDDDTPPETDDKE